MENTPTPDPTPDSPISALPAGPSKPRRSIQKQAKPYPEFPLFWHARGYWCCKRGGQQIPYSADWKKSLMQFNKDESARARGEPTGLNRGLRMSLKDAVNEFMTRQTERLAEGKISPVQFAKYRFELSGDKGDPKADPPRAPKPGQLAQAVSPTNIRLGDLVGSDASLIFSRIRSAAARRGLSACERHVICVRAMLDYVHDRQRLPKPNYGDAFDKPSVEQLRKARTARDLEKGERAWTTGELARIVAAARKKKGILHCCCLLALNCGYQAADIGGLPLAAIDEQRKLIRFPRAKNGMARISPLWDETYRAIQDVISHRPKGVKAEYKHLAILTRKGLPPCRVNSMRDQNGNVLSVSRTDSIQLSFKRMVGNLKLARPGAGFNTLRAMFRTLCTGASADPDLVAIMMGRRVSRPVDEFYLRGDLRDKLVEIVDHVHSQIWPNRKPARQTKQLKETR